MPPLRRGLTGFWGRLPFLALLLPVLCFSAGRARAAGDPIRLHPENPRYFEYRGKALALVGSGEHYGLVLNPDLNVTRYLDALAADGLNYTRVFAGTYVEPPGAFGIERNTLAPAPGRFLAPWARSKTPGYAGGGNRFDLTRWDDAYFDRLKTVLKEAARRGVIVELTLFCSTYSDLQWSYSPFNPLNNVNGLTLTDWRALNTLTNAGVLAHQEALVRKLAQELGSFDNLIYEIQNEPWADHHVMGETLNPYLPGPARFPNAVEITTTNSLAWQARIAQVLAEAEAKLRGKHLIAQNVANFRLAVRDPAPGVGMLNFHYALPEAVSWNQGLGLAIGCDETGFAGTGDDVYRRQAWHFVLAGGGLFNHLDYSFSVGKEDGSDSQPRSPGGGSPRLRKQLGTLARYLQNFDLTTMGPDSLAVQKAPGFVARTLATAGRQYAIHLEGPGPGSLVLALPFGKYAADWIDPVTGAPIGHDEFQHGGGAKTIAVPASSGEAALFLRQVPRCCTDK